MGDEADAMWEWEMIEQGQEDSEHSFAERCRRPAKKSAAKRRAALAEQKDSTNG